MKNFLRALKHAWPYRRRLVISVVCAICAAVFWGANFTSIYPFLNLLNTRQTAQEWIDTQIAQTQTKINDLRPQIEALRDRKEEYEQQPSTAPLRQQIRDASRDLAALESKLSSNQRWFYWYQVASKYIHKWVPPDCFRALALVIGLVVVGLAIKCVFEFAQESLVGSVVNLSLYDLRNRFYRNVIRLDIDQFGEQGTGELMARFTNDMESLGTGIKTLFGKVVVEPLRALSCIVIACFISWQLTAMFLILVPIAAFILSRVGRIMKRATRRLLERMSNIYKILQESFQGIRVVKAFTRESHERRRFRLATRDYYHKAMMVVNIDALADPLIELLGVMAVAGALLAGAYLVLQGKTHLFGLQMSHQPLRAESLLNLYILLAAIADPVRKLSSVSTRLQSACAAADRVFAFLDRQPRIHANSDGPRLEMPTVEAVVEGGPRQPPFIEFRNVCFSYEPNTPILTNINLAVNVGETIALVGQNGCGKSTLLNLLPRFYDPDHGSILMNGLDLRTLNLRSVRQQIGLVNQDTFLFDDTIYNNIAYGARGSTAEQVEEAARRALAHDFIARLPRGYQTRVGEAGLKLSGGQKQRLCLARAILRNPSILLLDEFTSAADAGVEAEIYHAMKLFMAGRTTFVITHRLNTLEIATRIVVLENGRIAAVGSHPELLAGCLPYQRLHEAYTQRLCA